MKGSLWRAASHHTRAPTTETPNPIATGGGLFRLSFTNFEVKNQICNLVTRELVRSKHNISGYSFIANITCYLIVFVDHVRYLVAHPRMDWAFLVHSLLVRTVKTSR